MQHDEKQKSPKRNCKVLQARHDDVEELYAFSSERKMASVLLREPGSLLLYNKARHARNTTMHYLHACRSLGHTMAVSYLLLSLSQPRRSAGMQARWGGRL